MSKKFEIKLNPDVSMIIDRFEKAGYEAYLVGGSLRDTLLGREAYDNDLTTSALPEQTLELFSDLRTVPTGLKHGTVTLITESGLPIEVTTFRTDGTYSDSRHPDSVSFTRSLKEDLSRRDFTVNAMAYAPKKGLVDLFGGREDLSRGIIRCVGDPERRFSEDALRILRGFRFSAQLGFEIEKNTLKAAIDTGPNLTKIARERISVELLKILSSPKPSKVLTLMLPLMPIILPGIVLDPSRIPLCDNIPPEPIERLALLIHGGNCSAAATALRLSNIQKKKLRLISEFSDHRLPSTPPEARRLLSSFGDSPHLALTAVRVYSAISGRDLSKEERLVSAELGASPCLTVSELSITGEDLIKRGVAPGKQLGLILSALLDAVIEDPSLNRKEVLLELSERIKYKNNL